MKKLLFFLIGMQTVVAQEMPKIVEKPIERKVVGDTDAVPPPMAERQVDENLIYNMAGIEVKPTFPGGMDKFRQFVDRNIQAPSGLTAPVKVYAAFIVEKDGSLNDIKIIRDASGRNLGAEAVRLLKASPRWIPGEQNGIKVRVMYSLPIEIKPSPQPAEPKK